MPEIETYSPSDTEITILHPAGEASPTLLKKSLDTTPSSTTESDKLPELREAFKGEIAEVIRNTTGDIIVVAHVGPDEDAIGAAIGEKRILERLNPGKHFKVVFTDRRIDAWDDFLKPNEITWAATKKGKTPNGKTRQGDVVDHIQNNDTVFFLDGGTLDRFSRVPGEMRRKENIKTLVLDHHMGEPAAATVSYVEPSSTSACEIIARMYGPESLTPDEAEILLLGILGDTNSFTTGFDHSETKALADQLRVKAGKSYEEIMGKVRHSAQEALYRKAFENHLRRYTPPDAPSQTYSYLTAKDQIATLDTVNSAFDRSRARRDFAESTAQKGETDLLWTIAPVKQDERTALITEYNISLRRSPISTIDLNTLATTWGGGGHEGAAAGTYKLSPQQLEEVKQNKQTDPNFDEAEYVCEIIAKDIAERLTLLPQLETSPEESTSQIPPFESSAEEQTSHPESETPTEHHPETQQTEAQPEHPTHTPEMTTHALQHEYSRPLIREVSSPTYRETSQPAPIRQTRWQKIRSRVRSFFTNIKSSWGGFGRRIKSFFSQFLR